MSKHPAPTGNPWKPDRKDPATVPVPLPVIIVKIEGPYTERDRKLWAFLLHAVWNELGVKSMHELPITKINQVFRECGSDHNAKWIWESAKRLARTIAEWEQTFGDERYEQGVSAIFAAVITKESREKGILHFSFPAPLIPILKEPRRFARLRVHFLLRLSDKYAVTLYELLEGLANKDDPVLTVPLEVLRQWLKVPEGKFKLYGDFKRWVLSPAIKQINNDPTGAGFTVYMQPIKKSRAVHRVQFHVKKVDQRRVIEEAMQSGIPLTKVATCRSSEADGPLFNPVHLSTTVYERARKAAPGWDIYYLESQWRDWIAGKEKPKNPDVAFIAFCRKKYQRERHQTATPRKIL
jgi:hypothetical protein